MSEDIDQRASKIPVGEQHKWGEITSEKRNEDWIAFWAHDRGVWEAGSSQAEAIGHVYMTLHRQNRI